MLTNRCTVDDTAHDNPSPQQPDECWAMAKVATLKRDAAGKWCCVLMDFSSLHDSASRRRGSSFVSEEDSSPNDRTSGACSTHSEACMTNALSDEVIARKDSNSTADLAGTEMGVENPESWPVVSDEGPMHGAYLREMNRRNLPYMHALDGFAALSDEHKEVVRNVFIDGKLKCNSQYLPSQLRDILPLTLSGRLTSIGSIQHPDRCIPCEFWSKRLCSRGGLCTFCHVHHENVARAKPSKDSRHKRRDRLINYIRHML